MGYARILKDNNGKPSGYRECDGEVLCCIFSMTARKQLILQY